MCLEIDINFTIIRKPNSWKNEWKLYVDITWTKCLHNTNFTMFDKNNYLIIFNFNQQQKLSQNSLIFHSWEIFIIQRKLWLVFSCHVPIILPFFYIHEIDTDTNLVRFSKLVQLYINYSASVLYNFYKMGILFVNVC